MIMERVWPEYLEDILMKVCDVVRTLAQQLVERFPRKHFLDSLSILQSTYWEKPQVVSLENSLEFLVGFYGTEKVQLVGSSTNNTIAPLIDGNLLLAQAKRFKDIMHDTVPAIRAAVEKRKR